MYCVWNKLYLVKQEYLKALFFWASSKYTCFTIKKIKVSFFQLYEKGFSFDKMEFDNLIYNQFSKAVANYHVRNGRMQNSLLSSLLCSAIDGFNAMALHKREESNEFCIRPLRT